MIFSSHFFLSLKGAQLFSTIGLLVVPFVSIIRRKPFTLVYRRYMTILPLFGVTVSLALLTSKAIFTPDLTPDGIDDRSVNYVNFANVSHIFHLIKF